MTIIFLFSIIKHQNYRLHLEYPEMSYTSEGKLTFLTRHEDNKEWMKPIEQLVTAPITIGNVSFEIEQCTD